MNLGRCPRRDTCEANRSGTMFFGARAAIALIAVAGCLASAEGVAQGAQKTNDSVRLTADQMQQVRVIPVPSYPFRVQKHAIGQIAYNEDTSTAVLAPFSGRVV